MHASKHTYAHCIMLNMSTTTGLLYSCVFLYIPENIPADM